MGVEHLDHCLRLGETAVSDGPSPEHASEVVLRFDSVAILHPLRLPRLTLLPIGVPMRPLKLWDKITDKVKRDMLFQLGVRDPRDEVLPESPSFILTMWGEYMRIGFVLGEKTPYKFVSSFFVRALVEGSQMLEQPFFERR